MEVNDAEAVRHFNIPNEKLPHTFRLLRVQGLPAWANTSAVSIDDVIQVRDQLEFPLMLLILVLPILF